MTFIDHGHLPGPSQRRPILRPSIATALLLLVATIEASAKDVLIGYTELRTDLPGGRHANVATMRAAVVGWTATAVASSPKG